MRTWKTKDLDTFKTWSADLPFVELERPYEFRDGHGFVAVGLHGTTHDFDEFCRMNSSVESDHGKGFYFSNVLEDVNLNYAGIGHDLKNRIDLEKESLEREVSESEWAEDKDQEEIEEEAERLAMAKLVGHEGAIMPVFIKFLNPVIIGGRHETAFDLEEEYDEESDSFSEPTGKMLEFFEALREIEGSGDFYDFDAEKAIVHILSNMEDTEMRMSRLIEVLGECDAFHYAIDANCEFAGNMAAGEIRRLAFETMGYDGIIDTTVNTKFGGDRGMKGLNPYSVHYIAFNADQVKSAIGNIVFAEDSTSLTDIDKQRDEHFKKAANLLGLSDEEAIRLLNRPRPPEIMGNGGPSL